MSSNHGHGAYDQSLLASAPETTKQMRQEGYNSDILNAPKKSNSINTHGNRDLESGTASKEHLALTSTTPIPSRRVPFYRTRKGMIIIAVAALVVIGAVVGGAVGGTRKKKDDGDVQAGDAPGSDQKGPGDAPGPAVAPASNSSAPVNPLSAVSQALSSSSATTTTGQAAPTQQQGQQGQQGADQQTRPGGTGQQGGGGGGQQQSAAQRISGEVFGNSETSRRIL
ncbi:hypothetical protein V5O48_004580 [Marasmius crinis-equi]|uniref:Uncharacterized protein n=1 Tax=Marasmius crinis-equi TaxID=585013 RepID=A0ABR3FQ82_9AGAR